MGYQELPPAAPLRELVECAWTSDATGPVRVLPDGCMDLIHMGGRVVVAGPDVSALSAPGGPEPSVGLRFRPGVLPRLLGVPAEELVGARVPLEDVRAGTTTSASLSRLALALAADPPRRAQAPWSLTALHHFTAAVADGTRISAVAEGAGWSARTVQRHCRAVYGYGPTTLRRILRFRRAVAMLRDGRSLAEVAARAGYADQPHLHREVREFAGVPAAVLSGRYANGANRSTEVPSGSSTVA